VQGVKAAATVAAFIVVLVAAGAVAYTATDDEPPATTTTTTTVRAPTGEETAEAITAALSRGLEVPLDATEAACVTDGLLTVVGLDRLEELTAAGADADDLTEAEREELVRSVVLCVPPEKAEAMLNTKPPPPPVGELPDEGAGG
jgi:hypothetical protein